MRDPTDFEAVAEWMRRDWNERARKDAERSVYTRDSAADEAGFRESGRANYNQLVRPYLPVLLQGADPVRCRALEIGCGIGRMTEWFAASFGEVHGIDVSAEMLQLARGRLAHCGNVTLHPGSGFDLHPLPGAYFDLVFSYIVFQHIPSAEVIRSYIHEAARVLKNGGAFKFQVNGDQSQAYREHQRGTWLGETFSRGEVCHMLEASGLALESLEDPETQYFVVTARKGAGPDSRSRYLPGEPQDGGWRPVPPRISTSLVANAATRLYAGIYFWPADPHPEHTVTMIVNGEALPAQVARGPGDHFLEWPIPREGPVEITMEIAPACAHEHRPALRIIGIA